MRDRVHRGGLSRRSSTKRSLWATRASPARNDETIVVYETYPGESADAFAQPFRDHGLIRLAIGLEAPEDLVANLAAALTTAYGSP